MSLEPVDVDRLQRVLTMPHVLWEPEQVCNKATATIFRYDIAVLAGISHRRSTKLKPHSC